MFVFSKNIGILLNPLLWIVLLTITAWFTKNTVRKRQTTGLALISMLFFTNSWIIQNLMLRYQANPIPMATGEQYAAGILLGGLVDYDESFKQGFFNQTSDRFIQTVRLYKEGHIRKVIVSGGNAIFAGDDFREADFLVENLLAMGVLKEDILSEREAINTIENSRLTHRITDSLHLKEPFVLITSAFHMPRAMKIFVNEGMQVRAYPCAYLVLPSDKKISLLSLVPSVKALSLWNIYLKEQVGNLFIRLQKK
ncbi:MAG: YdcF family protein [Chitinophagaceae bacterium]